MCEWFGDEWVDIKRKVYEQINMKPTPFEGEIKSIIDTVEEVSKCFYLIDFCKYIKVTTIVSHFVILRCAIHSATLKYGIIYIK